MDGIFRKSWNSVVHVRACMRACITYSSVVNVSTEGKMVVMVNLLVITKLSFVYIIMLLICGIIYKFDILPN